ncbi:MAG: YtxH domain-containing protein [Bacteroidia bacterium]|nr:YtxH domain-containing protein [Bacteroidia bacterium]
MNIKNVLAFVGGLAVGAAVGILFAPEKGKDTRVKIIAYLAEKGISKDRFEEIIAKVKAKISDFSNFDDVKIAVDEALNEEA